MRPWPCSSARREGGSGSFSGYEVAVANDGARLPDDVERLFQRGIAGPAGGTGLGLAIARELAERMRGSVTAANAPDGLVAFTLSMQDFLYGLAFVAPGDQKPVPVGVPTSVQLAPACWLTT